jgi:glycosyltransferase involved in cell wall biosynthesis
MDDIRVVMVAEDPKRAGGPATWARGLVAALEEKGLDVHLAYASDRSALRAVSRLARPGTIVHTYSQAPTSLLAARSARWRGAAVVHTVHGDFTAEQAAKRGVRRALWLPFNRRAVSVADAVTVPSDHLAQSLVSADPELERRLSVIPNGISRSALAGTPPYDRVKDMHASPDALLVVAVTTFTHRAKAEGVAPICEAVQRLREAGHDIELRVAGGGPLLDEIQERCSGPGIGFLGPVPDGVRAIIAGDVFVHSSGLDVFAYVVLEAFAVGVPCVVTPVGGVLELVGAAAVPVPLGDVDKMVEAVGSLADDPDRRAELAELGRNRAADFDWGPLVQDHWIPLYRETVTTAKGQTRT